MIALDSYSWCAGFILATSHSALKHSSICRRSAYTSPTSTVSCYPVEVKTQTRSEDKSNPWQSLRPTLNSFYMKIRMWTQLLLCSYRDQYPLLEVSHICSVTTWKLGFFTFFIYTLILKFEHANKSNNFSASCIGILLKGLLQTGTSFM